MKPRMISCLFLLEISFACNAATLTYSVGATIPDGDLNGFQNSQTISVPSGPITDLNVTLNISGGFNGDYYAFLTHGNATAILINRVGRDSAHQFGYPDAGFGPNASAQAFTFDDQAANDVHTYRSFSYTLNGSGQLTGSWQPDGRVLDPLSPASAFDAAPRPSNLGVFNGMDPNGLWTLYIADVSPGGEGTFVGWGLQITTVPEPTAAAVLFIGLAVFLYPRKRLADESFGVRWQAKRDTALASVGQAGCETCCARVCGTAQSKVFSVNLLPR